MNRNCLFALLILAHALASTASYALGGPAPKKEEPQYKMEILKMDLVTAPAQSLEGPTGEGKPKYKMEILKMDLITTPLPSWESEKKK